ncbi:uncharacterized protein LOC143558124 [Bidens hawaiensis]|uniref:uncharacterized protein LOC143558124 n=1 Tax=Bidens hawaiensis TaxID=980011 RepID=UPI00404909BA
MGVGKTRALVDELTRIQLISFTSIDTIATLQLTVAVEYNIINHAAGTPGGKKFNNVIGVDYTYQTLADASAFIWSTWSSYKQDVAQVRVFINEHAKLNGMEVPAYTLNNNIRVSAKYIQDDTGNVKTEITGVLYHEMTHVWQWDGNGQAPRGLTEGIADYVRLKAGFVLSYWAKPREGNKWDEGYSVTARFLDYCNSLKHGFVAKLNRKMRDGYNVNIFVELLGKPVDQLWAEYKG